MVINLYPTQKTLSARMIVIPRNFGAILTYFLMILLLGFFVILMERLITCGFNLIHPKLVGCNHQ